MAVEGEVLHIRLRREGEWPPFDHEEVNGVPLEGHQYRLASPPAFAKRLAVGDVVRVIHAGDPEVPWVSEVVERSGHSTVRVIVFKDGGQQAEDRLEREAAEVGVSALRTCLDGLFVIDIPAGISYPSVRTFLASGAARGVWDYEEAAISAHHDAQQ